MDTWLLCDKLFCWDTTQKFPLTPPTNSTADQGHIPQKSILVSLWVLSGLLKEIWVRGYLHEQKWLKVSFIIKAHTASVTAHKIGNLEHMAIAWRQLSRLGRVFFQVHSWSEPLPGSSANTLFFKGVLASASFGLLGWFLFLLCGWACLRLCLQRVWEWLSTFTVYFLWEMEGPCEAGQFQGFPWRMHCFNPWGSRLHNWHSIV